jgi:hypothetical protein
MSMIDKATREADENERTTETGLFHYAVSYNGAADYLGKTGLLDVTHPEAPREFLYAHAIELYLKAFLRNEGMTVQELRSIGHNLERLQVEYQRKGGNLSENESAVFRLFAANNSNNELRYIQTGFYRKPSMEDISKATASLRRAVGKALAASGRILRWYDDGGCVRKQR